MNTYLPKPLLVSAIETLAKNQQEIKNFHDISRSDIIDKSIEGSIINTSLNKPRLHWREYEWTDDGFLVGNNVITTIIFYSKASTQI